MDNKGIVQNDITDAQDKVQKPQQDLKEEIKNLNKDIVKFTKLKNEKESEIDNLLNLQISSLIQQRMYLMFKIIILKLRFISLHLMNMVRLQDYLTRKIIERY